MVYGLNGGNINLSNSLNRNNEFGANIHIKSQKSIHNPEIHSNNKEEISSIYKEKERIT